MFDRFKTLVFRSAVDSADAPFANMASDPPLFSKDEYMVRTKRKRDDTPDPANQRKEAKVPRLANPDDEETNGKKVEEQETPKIYDIPERSLPSVSATTIPVSPPSPTLQSSDSRKRRRSAVSDDEDSQPVRRSKARKDVIDQPTFNEAAHDTYAGPSGMPEQEDTRQPDPNIGHMAPDDEEAWKSSHDGAGYNADDDQETAEPTVARTKSVGSSSSPAATLTRRMAYRPSKHLRKQAKVVARSAPVSSDSDGEGKEGLRGIGAWEGSAVIPGTLRRKADGVEDRIQLPRRKPKRVLVGQSIEKAQSAQALAKKREERTPLADR